MLSERIMSVMSKTVPTSNGIKPICDPTHFLKIGFVLAGAVLFRRPYITSNHLFFKFGTVLKNICIMHSKGIRKIKQLYIN